YRVSEAIATSLELDRILDVILDAVMEEVAADVVTLHLQDPVTDIYEERIKRVNTDSDVASSAPVGTLDLDELLAAYRADRPIVSHGLEAARFFLRGFDGQKLVSFVSVPMKIRDRVIGMLNAYSYTRGKMFDEGQRKMLVILASRAAVSIENGRLY